MSKLAEWPDFFLGPHVLSGVWNEALTGNMIAELTGEEDRTMDKRTQRKYDLLWASVIILALATLAIYLGVAIHMYENASTPQPRTPTYHQGNWSKDWRPDISHCFNDAERTLWDCVRNHGTKEIEK